MNVGGGGSNEGRVSSLERPPPPPHSHSVAHNVGNLLHMAGSFYSSCVNQYDYFFICSVIKNYKKKYLLCRTFLMHEISFLLNNNHAFLFFTPQNGCKVRLSMLLFLLILFIRTVPWNTSNLIRSRIVCGLILSSIFANMKKFNVWLYRVKENS